MAEKKTGDSGTKKTFLSVHEELLQMLKEKKQGSEDLSEPIAPFEMGQEAETSDVGVEEVPAVKEESDAEPIMEPGVTKRPKAVPKTVAPLKKTAPTVKEKPDTEAIMEPVVVPMAAEPTKPVNAPQFQIKKAHLLVVIALVGVCAILYLSQLSKSKRHESNVGSANAEALKKSIDENAPKPFDPLVLQPLPIRKKSNELEE